MKRVYIVERTDHHGEFQPVLDMCFHTREECVKAIEEKKAKKFDSARYRPMIYARQENKS